MKKISKFCILLFLMFIGATNIFSLQEEQTTVEETNDQYIISVPTARTLQANKFYFSLGWNNIDRETHDVDINYYNISFAYGINDRFQLEAKITPFVQVDIDNWDNSTRFNSIPFAPYVIQVYPFNIIEQGFGDVEIGAKYSLMEESETAPGLSLRGFFKIPTADESKALGSGAVDAGIGLILGKEVGNKVDFAAFGEFAYIGTPGDFSDAGYSLSHEFRYGLGIKLPTTSKIRAIAELTGIFYLNDDDFPQEAPLDALVGFEFKFDSGLRISMGVRRNLTFPTEGATRPDGGMFLISYTPPKKVTKVVEKPTPPPPPPPENRNPVVALKADPPVIEEGASSRVIAEASDPDGDPLTYFWSAEAGKIEGEGSTVTWNAPAEGTGKFTVSCRVEDGKGGSASDSTIIEVIKKKEEFEDIYFAFDKYELTDQAKEKLDRAAQILAANPELKVQIEGHCCYIGTEEYNMALGEHRALAINEYLINIKGIDSSRITTISYGETKPQFDNSREETRRYNRRGHFKVIIY